MFFLGSKGNYEHQSDHSSVLKVRICPVNVMAVVRRLPLYCQV